MAKKYLYDKRELNEWINKEESYYNSIRYDKRNKIVSLLDCDNEILIKRYLKVLRKSEYYLNNSFYKTRKKKNILYDLKYLIILRKKYKLGRKLGFEIEPNCFGKGLTIYHAGGIIVNGNARIGQNCILHGQNVIGNNGKNNKAPILGNNVRLGMGAKIIGDVKIADNVVIGAGAVVVKSIQTPGAVVVGVPGKIVHIKDKNHIIS